MDGIKRVGGLLLFMVRFFLLVVPLVVGWWALVPYYGMLLAQLAGGLAHYVLGMTLLGVGVRLEPETVLNTGTNILFQVPATDKPFHQFEMPVALLVTNLAPYLALVLATWGIPLWQRLKVLLIGSSIIIAGHVLFVTILLRFQDALKQYSEIATSTIQLFLVMPVLLWVWLVYSEKISAYLEEAEEQRAAENAGKQG
jgi:hypothetical protein